jgi:hypothetical protein
METIMPKPDSGPTISTECRRGPGAIEIIFRLSTPERICIGGPE